VQDGSSVPAGIGAAGGRPERAGWVDTARGLGIALVVFGHAQRGLITSGAYSANPTGRTLDALIYAFHMPLFFLLSGLFVARSLAGGRERFVRTRVTALAYPYLLWSMIQALLSMGAANVANHPITFGQLSRILWHPVGQFWFLYALLLCQLVTMLPRRLLIWVILPAAIGAVALLGIGSILLQACWHFPYFLAGFLLTIDRLRPIGDRRLLAAAALLCWTAFAVLFMHRGDGAPLLPQSWLLGFSGTFGTLAVSRLLPEHGVLTWLGRASMPIYLMHTISTAAVRGLLLVLAPGLPFWGMVAALTLAGILLPYAVYRLACRLRLDAILGFDRSPQGPARLADDGLGSRHGQPIVR
jgi:fucose 4-O-acetylase-like acetyltransferase